MTTLGWYDTGFRSATWHQALDLHAFRRAHKGVASLRFHRYWPTASIGVHDDSKIAVRADYCSRRLIAVIRRLTGGEVAYLDPGTLCFSLAFRIPGGWGKKDLCWLMARLAGTVAASLRMVGIDAVFREPNEIELSDRRLGAVFIAAEGHAILCQGYLLTRLDIETLLKVVRAPLEKLSPEGVQNARERFITLDDCRPGLSVRYARGSNHNQGTGGACRLPELSGRRCRQLAPY
ncbi:MAG: lipoate--protein ligase family protein [Acidiferrobacteraceae bacterium]